MRLFSYLYPCAEKESVLSQGQSQDKSRLVTPHFH